MARAHLPAVLPWLLAGLTAAADCRGTPPGGTQAGGTPAQGVMGGDAAAADALLAVVGEALQDEGGDAPCFLACPAPRDAGSMAGKVGRPCRT